MGRIGLFGGTFNPVHLGHVRAVQDVQHLLGLDEVVVIPSAQPPHKPSIDLAPGADRLAMIRLAIADCPALAVSDIELQRPGPSYTIDTVGQFLNRDGADDRFVFIVGIDAFLEMDGWHRYQELFKAIAMVVITRPGSASGMPMQRQVEAFLQQNVSGGFAWQDIANGFAAPGFCPVTVAAVTPVDICATGIRALVGQGRSITGLVHPAVARYIGKKGLYR